jgi:tetratricopeptide (TPR) repeat protein
MKKAILLIAIILGSFSLSQAQELKKKWGEDSVKCTENLYIYYELAKAKNYAEAYDAWLYVFNNCPGCSKNNFIFGPPIVETQIKKTESQEKKDELTKLLMNVYDTRLLYYPEKHAYVYERKALDMQQHWPDSVQQYYDIFEKALELDKVHSAAFYNGYFIAVARLFNKDVFEIGQVFDAYNVVIEGIEYNTDELNRQIRDYQDQEEAGTLDDKGKSKLARAERELGRYDDVSSNINKILGPIATCEKLELIYNEETFEENKTDATWLRRAAKMLEKERNGENGEETDCTDNPIFAKVAEALYEIEPSVAAARAISTLYLKNKEYSKALPYIKEAAEGEVDLKKQASDYLRMASVYLKLNRLAEAKAAAMKAARLRKGWGKPYILMASIYAAGDNICGSNVFEKKAVYWAAIDKLKYAKSIDPNVAAQANKLIGIYKQQLPEKSVIFTLGVTEGDKHTIGCYINETITVDYSL